MIYACYCKQKTAVQTTQSLSNEKSVVIHGFGANASLPHTHICIFQYH